MSLPIPRDTATNDLLLRVQRQEAEIQSLCAEVLERYEEATFVYRLSERIGSALGESAIARLVIEDVAQVLGARRGEVWLRDGGALTLVGCVGDLPHGETASLPDEAAAALERAAPWLRERSPSAETSLAVPIPSPDDSPMGLFLLRGRNGGRSYRTGETKLLTAIAALTSAFVRIDRLAAKARLADARRREDEIARQVHRGLLPRQDPVFAGLQISGGFRAAEIVGGDYYGYVPMEDGSLGVAIADVSGHGVGAALYMATAKGAIQAEARRETSPSVILARTNDLLVGDFSEADMFATGCFLRFGPGGTRVTSTNGGHHPPVLVRANGEVHCLEQGGPAMGVFPAAVYREEETALEPGDALLLYTDGLVEARDAWRTPYGCARLVELARKERGGSASEIRARLLADLEAHCAGLPPRDDVTLVVIRSVPAPGAGGVPA